MIISNVTESNIHHSDANSGIYDTLYTGSMHYQYTERPLGEIIEKLSQACYLQISEKYVAIYHCSNNLGVCLISQSTYQTLRPTEMVIMTSNGTDIPTNLHEDLHKILRDWYYNEYESPSALIRRCLRNN